MYGNSKVKFRQSSANDKEGTIYYQVIHNRVARQVTTGYKVYVWEWDEKHRNIIMQHDTERTNMLMSIRDKMRWDMNRFNRIMELSV